MGLSIPRKANLKRTEINNYEALIKQFMDERDFPDWFRGTSQFQIDAADSLHNCIRDDSEQGTSHRVRDALIKLGIEPLVSGHKIKLAMRLSRGNDMAFLWFLMELYYRNACDDCEHYKSSKYTMNEQLIMTTIAHLDMVPTLRELDQLLPVQPERPKKVKKIKKKPAKVNYVLPYFEKLARPVIYGKSMNNEEGDTVANLGEYDMYIDPKYVVPNESNRWFANYELKKEKKYIKRIVDEDIENNIDASPQANANQISNQETIMKRTANELIVAKKKDCEKYFDLEGNLKEQANERFLNMFSKQLEIAEENLRKEKKDRTLVSKMTCGLNSITEEVKNRISARSAVSQQTAYDEYFNKYDFGHADAKIQNSNFFEAPTCNKPYKFNYNKIFDTSPRNAINQAFNTALSAGSYTSINYNRAVSRCCKKIWRTEVQKYNTEWDEKERERQIQEEANPKPQARVLNFNLPYYDPYDKQLMETMLIQALNVMKKDKKFVLASLVDAHKMPILKEWVKKRYGHTYTRKSKIQAFEISKKMFHILKKNEIDVQIPRLHDLSKTRNVSYSHRDYILRKTNYLTDKYHHNFRVTHLENTRIYWGVMRPFQCSKGPPRNEFFAYLPARENDVHMFRPWKTCEYVPAKVEWDRRRKILLADKH